MADIPGMKGTDVFFGDPAQPLPDWRRTADDGADDDSDDPTPEQRAAVVGVLGLDPAELWASDATAVPAVPPAVPRDFADALLAYAEAADWQCGPLALAAIAERFGIEVSPEDLVAELGATPANGTPPEAMLEGVRKLGLQADGRERMTVEQLQAAVDADCPVIVCIQDPGEPPADRRQLQAGHWVLIEEMATGAKVGRGVASVSIADPAKSETYRLRLQDFLRLWVDQDGGGKVYSRFGIIVSDGPQ